MCQLALACMEVGMSRLGSVWAPGEHCPGVALRLAPRGVLWAEPVAVLRCWMLWPGRAFSAGGGIGNVDICPFPTLLRRTGLALTSAKPLLKPPKSESRCVSPLWAASLQTQPSLSHLGYCVLCPGGQHCPVCAPVVPAPVTLSVSCSQHDAAVPEQGWAGPMQQQGVQEPLRPCGPRAAPA